MVFSPARNGRTSETKDTHENVKKVPEVVINVVTYDIVEQVVLASSPYPKGVDEFVEAGFTPLDSDLVRPKRVKESPVQYECKVLEIKELGTGGASGNLVICEVVKIHVREDLLDANGQIDQKRLTLFHAWAEVGIVIPMRQVCLRQKDRLQQQALDLQRFRRIF